MQDLFSNLSIIKTYFHTLRGSRGSRMPWRQFFVRFFFKKMIFLDAFIIDTVIFQCEINTRFNNNLEMGKTFLLTFKFFDQIQFDFAVNWNWSRTHWSIFSICTMNLVKMKSRSIFQLDTEILCSFNLS